MSHLSYTLLMALLVSGAVAVPGERTTRERIYAATYTLLACTVSIVAGGWFMRLVHG